MSDDEGFFTPVSFGFRKRDDSPPQYRLTAEEKRDAIERAEALRDELTARREQKLHEGVSYEWSAVRAFAHEFAAEQIREFIGDLSCEFGGHIPDMTNVNLGAILARLDRLATALEAEL